MLLALNPCDVDAPESKCSLEFATRLRGLELGRAQRHVSTVEAPAATSSGTAILSLRELPSHPITRISSASSICDTSIMSDHSAYGSAAGTDSALQPSSQASSADGAPASGDGSAATPPAAELQAKVEAQEVDYFALQEQLAQAQVCNPQG